MSPSKKKGNKKTEPAVSTVKQETPVDDFAPNKKILPTILSFDAYKALYKPSRIIKKILIANNGIAALKFIRSIRKWAYATFKNLNEIKFFCMATPEDINANAEYIKIADKIITVPGGSNINNYANVELIIQKAVENHVDAVWAGWGHASENPQLPGILAKKNIVFLGPSQQAMWSLGDKIAATILAQSVDVPTVPWSGSRRIESFNRESISFVPKDIFNAACIQNVEDCLNVANSIGYPVMIKASEGGGGKGIRKAKSADQVQALYNQVVNEVRGSPVFLMKCLKNVRHLEVQVLADSYGNAISLFGRDCSVQRRHQKILEEAPCITAPAHVFEAMEEAAIRLAKLVGYTSAGTVEYLYDPETEEFYFLELNPRLQVEHPCTEVVADVNLPACQLEIGMGLKLHQIKDIRQLYQIPETNTDDSFDLAHKNRRKTNCHVIAVRITSEDPNQGFRPHPGDVSEINFKSSRSVWGYFSVGSLGGIHEFADSQFGHCFSAADNRELARVNLVLAMKELIIRGDFLTTVEYLTKILESESYINNLIDTEWLDRMIASKDKTEKPNTRLGVICTALHVAIQNFDKIFANFRIHLERGQFLPSSTLSNYHDVILISEKIKYAVKVVRTGGHSFHLISNDQLVCVEVHRMSGGGLIVSHDNDSYMTYCHEYSGGYRIVIDNRTGVFEKEHDPSILKSPSTGKLIQFTVDDGEHIYENEVYALVEIMKLVLELKAPASGYLHHLRSPGATLEPGMQIARLKLDDFGLVKQVNTYKGPLVPFIETQNQNTPNCLATDSAVNQTSSQSNPDLNNERETFHDSSDDPQEGTRLQQRFAVCLVECYQVLCGYCLPEPYFSIWLNNTVETLLKCLKDPHLPLIELKNLTSQLASRLPSSVEKALRKLANTYSHQATSVLFKFPSDQILEILQQHIKKLNGNSSGKDKTNYLSGGTGILPNSSVEANISSFMEATEPLVELAERYRNGVKGHALQVISNIMFLYLTVENHFSVGQFDRCVSNLLSRCSDCSSSSNAIGKSSRTPIGNSSSFITPPSPQNLQAIGSSHILSNNGVYDDLLNNLVAPGSALLSRANMDALLKRLAEPTSVQDVLNLLFSHHQLGYKNSMILKLIEILRTQNTLGILRELAPPFNQLTSLGKVEHAAVALAARQFLIFAQTPSYELRKNQVESIFLSSIDNFDSTFNQEKLESLINSETLLFDILMEFLYHKNNLVASAALEVYVRRSYLAYKLRSVQHSALISGETFVQFKFLLPNIYDQTSRSNLSDRYCQRKESIQRNSSFVDVEKLRSKNSFPNVSISSARRISLGSINKESASFTGLSNKDVYNPMKIIERFGAMAVFENLEKMEAGFPEIMRRFAFQIKKATNMSESEDEMDTDSVRSSEQQDSTGRPKWNSSDSSSGEEETHERKSSSETVHRIKSPVVAFQDPPFRSHNPKEEPINILNICLLAACWESSIGEVPDNTLNTDNNPSELSNSDRRSSFSDFYDVNQLEAFCKSHAEEMRKVGIRRVTFLISKPRCFPKFYTFRAGLDFSEDMVYRNLEPALAFQLEINLMRNYELEQIPVVNRRMHLYLGRAKVAHGQEVFDYRFFVRSIIRHADFVSKAASFEYLKSEAERILLESMDALEVAFTHKDAGKTTGNHIFMNFASTMVLEDLEMLTETVKNTVLRYGLRLWRLRVTQAELKMTVRYSNSEVKIPLRLFLKSEQGYDLEMDVYQEMPDFTTGKIHYLSLGSKVGPLHGKTLGNPYETKDFIQLKRFNAQKFNTTFVYDYPKLIDQALGEHWKSFFLNMTSSESKSENSENKLKRSWSRKISSKVFNSESYQRAKSFNDMNERKDQLSSLLEECSFEVSNSSLLQTSEKLEQDYESPKYGEFVLECLELALDREGRLRPVDRIIGTNEIGMVVWYMVLKTPECRRGRPVVVIANDVTIKAGSFGPAEDLVFARASQLARRLGIPRIYLAANTGARIRLADEVKPHFQIEWIDELRPEKGFRYLYLTKASYELLRQQNSVICEKILVGDEERYKIDTILGKDHDMSVENLRGSAMIAGETSIAYEDCFTISVCTSRTIGIGAYLVRLGQRLIQVDNSHIILTGAMALNKLLSREVYSSNSQLGGVQIMATNGVTHFVVPDELRALCCVIQSLSYVPIRRGYRKSILRHPTPLQVAEFDINVLPQNYDESDNEDESWQKKPPPGFSWDVVDRPVTFVPTRDRPNDDPRWILTGVFESRLTQESNKASDSIDKSHLLKGLKKDDNWLSGFFDWGTFQETLESWAQGVIVGRARLGGISCGVIITETRSTIVKIPADPANPESEAININQAGQVWYPDSAYKTAQAISDFAREELPIFIFANWRGFSGGLKDMFDQVLKFGAMIVDALRRYPNPVYVYLPPHAELRGGAWVVVDPAINPDMMEMYADPIGARASVLEPEGTCEIKYRKPELIKLMNRLDPGCLNLFTKIADLTKNIKALSNLGSGPASPTRQDSEQRRKDIATRQKMEGDLHSLRLELEQRQKHLLPIYQQVARTFADLHDTPKRLIVRNLIDGLVPWRQSRRIFYDKLRRRLLELDAIRLIRSARCPTMVMHTNPRRNNEIIPLTVEDYPALPDMHVSAASIVGRPGWAEHDEIVPGDEDEIQIYNQRISHLDTQNVNESGLVSRINMREASPPGLNDRLIGQRPSIKLDRIQISSLKQPPRHPLINAKGGKTRMRTASESKVANDMLATSTEASQWIPKLAVKRSTMLRRDMTKLRRWFVDEYVKRLSSLSESAIDHQNTQKWSQEAQRLWESNDLVVGDWLAEQLKYDSLKYVALSCPRTVCFPEISATDESLKQVGASLMLNVDALRREAVLTQVRRLLEANPDLVTDVISSLTSTIPANKLCEFTKPFLKTQQLNEDITKSISDQS